MTAAQLDLIPSRERYQPRYMAYARAQGRSPEAQLAHDEAEWPGGRMCGFVLWISEKWREFEAGVRNPPMRLGEVQGRFDEFLVVDKGVTR